MINLEQIQQDINQLPEGNPFQENLLEILANWRKNLELRDNLSAEEQEEIISHSFRLY